jgi:circadian clock protein KaiC
MSEPNVAVLERVRSGVPGLDVILEGGFLKGGLYIIQGPPGTGKTTFGNQICFNHIAAEARAVYVTLLAEYHARMIQHLGAMSFFDASKIPDQLQYINGLGALHDSGLKGLVALLRKEVIAHGASILVIDGIVSARRAASDDQAFNEFVHQLQAVAIGTGCTVFILTSAGSSTVEPEHTMVDGIIELADTLTGWSAVSSLQVVKFRGSNFLRGRHAYKITGNGIVVHPRIEALLSSPSRPDEGGEVAVTSGIRQLDTMLGGGFPEASTTMVMGPSGTGKTTLGLAFLSACNPDVPGLLFGFYETPRRLRAKMAAVCPTLPALVDSGAVEILWQPPTNDLLDAYGERLLDAVRRRGVKRLFIDGLGAFQMAASTSGANRIGMFLTTLMNEMRVLGVTTLYTLEVPDIMGPGIRTSIGDLSSLAENLILLRFVEVGAHLHRLISILKVRDSQFDQSLHEFRTTCTGLDIEPASASAQAIMMGTPTGAGDDGTLPAPNVPRGA